MNATTLKTALFTASDIIIDIAATIAAIALLIVKSANHQPTADTTLEEVVALEPTETEATQNAELSDSLFTALFEAVASDAKAVEVQPKAKRTYKPRKTSANETLTGITATHVSNAADFINSLPTRSAAAA